MRKFIFILLIILFGITILKNPNNPEEIRVRIIPNSDDKKDIMDKDVVKEYVVLYLKQAYDNDYEIYVSNINSTVNELECLLNKVINEELSVSFDKHTLYNKTYNNSAVKNELHMTLYIVIGKGEGSNWWGSVYPEFLEVQSSEEVQYRSLIIDMFKKVKGDNDD